MHISAFSDSDTLFNVHGYRWWDGGRTSEDIENLVQNFPGKLFGVAEKGKAENLYGSEHIPEDNILQSKGSRGYFSERGLGIEDSDYLVLAGGQLGDCHWHAYQTLVGNEVSRDTEIVLAPKQCFGHLPPFRFDTTTYTLQDLLEGNLPETESEDYSAEQVVMSASRWDGYDWGRTSIRPIEF